MTHTRSRPVRSTVGPSQPPPRSMRRLLRSGLNEAGAAASAGQGSAETHSVIAALKEMPIPDPWNLQDFISALERRRRKPIRLMPYPSDAGTDHPCGLLLQCDEADVIFYEHSTSAYHRQQIILHEIGHIVLEHHTPSSDGPDVKLATELLPDLDADAIRLVLGRTTFGSDQEYQAELFASLLLSQQRTAMRGLELFGRSSTRSSGRR